MRPNDAFTDCRPAVAAESKGGRPGPPGLHRTAGPSEAKFSQTRTQTRIAMLGT